MSSSGAVDCGEGDSAPTQSGGREVYTGEGAVFPAPPHRELQAAVERWPGGRFLHCKTQRCTHIKTTSSGVTSASDCLQMFKMWRQDVVRREVVSCKMKSRELGSPGGFILVTVRFLIPSG